MWRIHKLTSSNGVLTPSCFNSSWACRILSTQSWSPKRLVTTVSDLLDHIELNPDPTSYYTLLDLSAKIKCRHNISLLAFSVNSNYIYLVTKFKVKSKTTSSYYLLPIWQSRFKLTSLKFHLELGQLSKRTLVKRIYN